MRISLAQTPNTHLSSLQSSQRFPHLPPRPKASLQPSWSFQQSNFLDYIAFLQHLHVYLLGPSCVKVSEKSSSENFWAATLDAFAGDKDEEGKNHHEGGKELQRMGRY